ncbi:MAG: replicative DNA helicase [Gammaproteobacteria bacterium]|nr:replicative DNA helicase [Gammaproteobacteria bacterium]MDE0251346.1 replicative DNA helicase [Gammaproteobacteria bacterium]MDE0401970.1 replicative DNA helicase [Gammaproteobacteria bacterium]
MQTNQEDLDGDQNPDQNLENQEQDLENELYDSSELDDNVAESSFELDDGVYNLEAERAILACLMEDETAWDRLTGLIEESDFYDYRNRKIFDTIRTLANQNRPTDEISVVNSLKDSNILEKAGGRNYVGDLVLTLHDSYRLLDYKDIVRARTIRRELIRASDNVRAIATQPDNKSVTEILTESEVEILRVGGRVVDERAVTNLRNEADGIIEQVREMEKRGGRIPGLESGYHGLDELTSGFRDNDLIIVAARPGMGKTAFSLNVCTNIALNTNQPMLFFSLEQDRDQLIRRMFAAIAGVPYHKLDRGENLTSKDWEQLESARISLSETDIFIVDKPGTTVDEMRAHIRRVNRHLASTFNTEQDAHKNRLAMVVVDYLQLITPGKNYNSRVIELGSVSRALKAMAKEFKIPVISVAQLNRNVENRENKRPRMADLRDSGEIEQDADLILFIYRDDEYDKESPYPGKAEIIVGKHRNGPCGEVRLDFKHTLMKFSNEGEDAYRANVSPQMSTAVSVVSVEDPEFPDEDKYQPKDPSEDSDGPPF